MDVYWDAVLYFVGGVLLLVTVLWLSATIYLYLVHRRYDHIPRPPMPSFYFGHIPTLSKMTKDGRQLGDIFLEWGQECGPFYVIFFMHVPAVVALKPEDIKEVLMNIRVPKSAKGYKAVAETFGQRFLGRGLITLLDFDSWRPRRSLYDPTFTKGYLRSLIPAFNGCVDRFLEWLKIQAIRKKTVPMRKELGAITLQILGKVFLEVLRLYPPGIGTSRESPSDDFCLSGYSIPKGTNIMLSFYANHRNPDHWDDPETFDPNRFSPARGKPSPFIYSPFSSGHRSCIGKVFAMMEGKIILSRLLSSFQVTLQEGYQLKVRQTTTLRPVDYVPCKLVPLN